MRFPKHLILTSMFLAGSLTAAQGDELNVYFSTGSTNLDGKAKAQVAKLAKKIAADSKVALMGSTDPTGSEDVNRRIRGARAESVKQALISAGIVEDRISTQDWENIDGLAKNEFYKLRRTRVTFEAGAGGKVASAKTTKTTEPTPAPEKPAVASSSTASTAEPKAATASATPKGKLDKNGHELEAINLIYWRHFNHALWILAKEKGFFEDEGFDATLKETDQDARVLAHEVIHTLPEGVASTNALKRGQRKFFAGAICGYATHEAMAKGEPIVDIGSMIMIPQSFVMTKELAKSIDQDVTAFRGKKIADLVVGQGEHDFKYMNVMKGYFEKAGLHDGKDYSVIPYLDEAKSFDDLLTHKIDITVSNAPSDLEFTQKHPEYTRVPYAKFFPYMPCCRQLVTRSQLKENRSKYVRLLRASIRAHEFALFHPVEAAQILGRWLKMPPSVVRGSLMSAYISLSPDPMRRGVEMYQRSNDKMTGTKTSTAEYLDTSLYRDALFSLAKENSDRADEKGYYDTMISRFRANN